MQDVYGKITARILTALQAGVVPWQQPWNGGEGAPRDLISGKPYRGLNVWLLVHRGGSPFWLTYRQARQIGGYVKQGAKGETVLFWQFKARKRSDEGQAEDEQTTTGRAGYVVARSYTVFNATQCELPEQWAARVKEGQGELGPEREPIDACERIVAGMPGRPKINTGGDRAFYRPSMDEVTMPERERFAAQALYYSVLFHELTHATGHAGRLGRAGVTEAVGFGSTNYSKEELVAEMGAAFLCGVAGIENRTVDTSAAYIKGWLKKLKDDPKMVVLAASQAQRAADYILGAARPDAE